MTDIEIVVLILGVPAIIGMRWLLKKELKKEQEK